MIKPPAGFELETAASTTPPDGFEIERPGRGAPAPAPVDGFVGNLARGFKRSLPETKSLAYGAAAAGAGLVGADRVRDYALERYQKVQREQVQPQQGDASFMGVVRGEDDLGDWAGDTLGNFAGQAVQSAVAAGAGALAGGALTAETGPGALVGAAVGGVGGLVARGAVKQGVEAKVAKLIAEGVSERAARSLAQRQLGGAALAGTGLNVAQEVGIGYTGRAEDAAAAGEDLTATDAARAIGFGVPAGLLDTAAEAFGVDKLLKGGAGQGMLGRVARGAAGQAVVEGGTEGAQAVLERAGAAQELTGDEAMTDYIENIAAGALGGGVLGGAGSIRQQQEEPAVPTPGVVPPVVDPLAPAAAAPVVPPVAPVTAALDPLAVAPVAPAPLPNSPLSNAVNLAAGSGLLAQLDAAAAAPEPVDETDPAVHWERATPEQRAQFLVDTGWINRAGALSDVGKQYTTAGFEALPPGVQSRFAKTFTNDAAPAAPTLEPSDGPESAQRAAVEPVGSGGAAVAAGAVPAAAEAGPDPGAGAAPANASEGVAAAQAPAAVPASSAGAEPAPAPAAPAEPAPTAPKVESPAEPPAAETRPADPAAAPAPASAAADPVAAAAPSAPAASDSSGESASTSTSPAAPQVEPQPSAAPTPAPVTARKGLNKLLKAAGRSVPDDVTAMKAFSDGDEVYAAHDMDDGGTPTLITSLDMLKGYTPDQMMVLARADFPENKSPNTPPAPAAEANPTVPAGNADPVVPSSVTPDPASPQDRTTPKATPLPRVMKQTDIVAELRRAGMTARVAQQTFNDMPQGVLKAGTRLGADVRKVLDNYAASKLPGKSDLDMLTLLEDAKKAGLDKKAAAALEGKPNQIREAEAQLRAAIAAKQPATPAAKEKSDAEQPGPAPAGEVPVPDRKEGSEKAPVQAADAAPAAEEVKPAERTDKTGRVLEVGDKVAANDSYEAIASWAKNDKGQLVAKTAEGAVIGRARDLVYADNQDVLTGKNAFTAKPDKAFIVPTRAADGGVTFVAEPQKPATVAEAAAAAATSPKNDLPAPTEAQIEAGNYKKGHITIQGLDVTIENPAGTHRRPEWPVLKYAYGYLKGTRGADSTEDRLEQIDVFVSEKALEGGRSVFVIDQNHKDGTFDEHKVMLGFANEEEARNAYLANYTKGWTGLGAITRMSLADFKAWLATDTSKPAGAPEQRLARLEALLAKETSGTPQYRTIAAEIAALKKTVPKPPKPSARDVREASAAVYRDLAGNPDMLAKSLEDLTNEILSRTADTPLGQIAAEKMAKLLHKELKANAAELAKTQHRDPQVLAEAIGAATAAAYPDAASLSPEQHAAIVAGFHHMLSGKTKSTLSGEHLEQLLKGYAGAAKWTKTPQGKAYYDGTPFAKLENTGLDLRRWYEQQQAELKGKATDVQKAWTVIERITARAHLFKPFLTEGMKPGFRKYVTDLRDEVTPFKEWLEKEGNFYGSYRSRSRYADKTKTNVDYMLDGSRYPNGGRNIHSGDEGYIGRNKWQDEAFRIEWLQTKASEYVALVRELTAPLDKAAGVNEAGGKFTAAFLDGQKFFAHQLALAGKGPSLKSSLLNADGERLRKTLLHTPSSLGLERFAWPSYYTETLVEKEATYELPSTTKPLLPPRLDHVTRTGMPDQRKGQNVTPAQFKATFGFADVGFGKWVGAKQDQDHLNYAFDAFMDLANHFGIPAKLIGLGGKMHFTIGALGHGKFAAHFQLNQPSEHGPVPVINVTNTKGDGTVYHEWGHAFDLHGAGGDWPKVRAHLLNVLKQKPLTPEAVDAEAKKFLVGGWYWKGDKKMPPEDAAARALSRMTTLAPTDYKKAADELDGGRDKPYWGNNEELIARVFEAWSGDTLGGDNSYLVNKGWSGEGLASPARGYRGTPYPTGDERKLFNQVMDALRSAVRVEAGRLSVSLEAFEAALPDTIKDNPGRARRDELLQPGNLKAFHQQLLAERAQRDADRDAERKAKADAEQAEADALAAQAIAAMAPPLPSTVMGPPTDADLSALFDQAAAELREETAEQPKAKAPGEVVAALASDSTEAELLAWKRDEAAAGRPPTANAIYAKREALQKTGAAAAPDKLDATAGKLIAAAAREGVTGVAESMKGLLAIFGAAPNRLNSFPSGFDADAYARAKPHFEAALKAFQAAGKSLKDLFKFLIQNFGDGIKQYAIQFAKDQNLDVSLGQGVSASSQLADWTARRLADGQAITWRELFAEADSRFGGTQGEGKYTPKDAYDAIEAGMNRYLMSQPSVFTPDASPEVAVTVLGALERALALLPTQTKRTAEQDEFQQYSTVPPLAFVANWVANVSSADTVLEPSAGIGGLATFAHMTGAKLVLNELSTRRAGVLQEVFPGSRVFHENAEQLNNILPDDVKPSLVIMNPPFSASAGRMEGVRKTAIGGQHVEQALARLVDGGRLVAIVGKGMALGEPGFKDWWTKASAKYDVRAVVPMDGSGYAKYGTTYDNVLLVIDKRAPVADRVTVRSPVKAYNELIGLLQGIRHDRPAAALAVDPHATLERDAAESARAEPDAAPQGDPAARPDPAGPGVVGEGIATAEPGVGGTPARPGRPGGADRPGGTVRNAGGSRGGDAGRADARSGGDGDAAPAGGPASGLTIESGLAEKAELTDAIFENYLPQKLRVPGALAHPGELVQSAAMASVPPPDPSYTPNLPKATIEKGLLSIAQLEAVVYAGQAHEQILPSGERRGFFIGDGTGVGKGREIAGIVLDNLRQGRKKAVWISEKQPLMGDAQRDFKGIGGDPELIFNQNKTNAEAAIDGADGILFTTYSTLRSGATSQNTGGAPTAAQLLKRFPKGTGLATTNGYSDYTVLGFDPKKQIIKVSNGYGSRTLLFSNIAAIDGVKDWNVIPPDPKAKKAGQSRLTQLVNWLGKDFDGVIAFDEAHNAGNAVAVKGSRGNTEPSAQALAVVELQALLPKARIVYVSATGATQVANLSYATRLGLWGKETPFASVMEFITEMVAGGLSTMELVARDMKQMGAYVARALSFNGVSYSRVEHELTPLQTDIYNRLAEAWQVTLQNFEAALELTGAKAENGKAKNKNAVAAAKSAYWGGQQRFFNQIITSMQMPSVLAQMDKDLAAGDALVLQLVNTNEAQQERALAKKRDEGDEDLDDLDLTPRDQLIQLVEKSFPVMQNEDYTDSDGKRQTRPVLDASGAPVVNKEAVALRDKLLADLKNIRVPDGPLEMIINHFGPEIVAEVTGRKQRVVTKPDKDGNMKAQIEKRGSASARADADAFMGDKKRVLIFSDAGGTGFSFHADKTQKNQRKRKHYLIQPGWRADKAVQGFGRTHRTNQSSAPHYYLAATNIPAHKRFLSSIARRLDQLGALTKGQRDTANQGLFSEKDNLESIYAAQAVRQLFEDMQKGQLVEVVVFKPGDVIYANVSGARHEATVLGDDGGDYLMARNSDGKEGKVWRKSIEGGTAGLQFLPFLRQMGLENIVGDDGQIAEAKMPATSQFLNRMLSLTLDMQERVFTAFAARMEEKVDVAIQRGELDVGMETIRALSASVASDDVIYTDPRTKAETRFIELDLVQANHFYTFPNIRFQGGQAEWVRNAKSGKVWLKVKSGTKTDAKTGAVTDRYRMMGTNGTAMKDANDFKQADAYPSITEAEAQALWDAENAQRPATLQRKAYMISGALLPIWDRLKTDSKMRVARTQTTDGQRLLGRMILAGEVAEIRKRFALSSAVSKMDTAQIVAAILKGQVAELANGWKIKRAMVSGELRIELTNSHGGTLSLYGPAEKELLSYGVIHERIEWQARFFIPTGAAGVPVLEGLTRSKPITDLVDPKAAASDAEPLENVARAARELVAATGTGRAVLTPERSRELGQADADTLRLRVAVKRVLGAAAARVEFLRNYDGLPAHLRAKVIAKNEGRDLRTSALYDPGTQRVFIFTDTVRTPERAVWNALHEIAGHDGLRSLFGDRLNAALTAAGQNPTVAALASAIGKARNLRADQRLLAIEEALAELAAAARSDNFEQITGQYGVTVGAGLRAPLRDTITAFLKRLRELIGDLFGRRAFTDEDVRGLLEAAFQAAGGDDPGPRGGQPLENVEPAAAAPAATGTLTLSPASKRSVKSWLAGKLTDLKPALLGAIPMNYLGDYAKAGMDAVQQYIDQRYQMDTFRNQLHQKYDAVAQEWLRYGTAGQGPAGLLGSKVNANGRELAELMHDSTIAGVDPTRDASDYDGDKGRLYDDLRARFDAMPQAGKDLYVKVRKSYTDQIKLLETTLEENFKRAGEIRRAQAEREFAEEVQDIRDSNRTAAEQQAAIEKLTARHDAALTAASSSAAQRVIALKAKFESMRVDAPYFPLKRFGRYFVAARDAAGDLVSFSKFATVNEANTFGKGLAERGYVVAIGLDSEKDAIRGAIDPRFVADIDAILSENETAANAAQVGAMRDAIYQRYLETLPDMSLRKSFIHRKKVPGYNPDALRSYSSTLFHGSYQIARLKYGMEMGETLEIADEQARRLDPIEGVALINELRKRHQWVMNPTGSVGAQVAASAAFVWHLGANPAHLFLNATQTAMLGLPILGSRYGFGATTKALLRAARDFGKGRGHIENALSGDEKRAMAYFVDSGLIDKSQAHDLAGVGETGVEYSANRQRVMAKLSWFFHQSERFNREVTAVAAYRLARAAGQSHEQAVDGAAKHTWQIHFDYSSGNRPRYMQGDVPKVLFVFRNYNVNLLYRLFRDIHSSLRGESKEFRGEAQRQLGAMMGMYALMAGVTGVPLYGVAMLLAGMFDDEDEPFSAEERFKQGTIELLGPDAAAYLLKGVPGTALGVDISERIGMPNLWFRSPDRQLEGRDAYYYWMEQLLGAVPAIAKNVFTGLQQMHEGNLVRGVETMVPNMIKSPARAVRYVAQDGALNLDGEKITDVDGPGVLAQLLGFTPAELAEQYDSNSALKGAAAKLDKRRQQLINRYAMATMQADPETARATLGDMLAFNQANPAFAITSQTIKRSLRTRANNEALSQGGIVMSKRLQALAAQREAQ